MSVINRENAEHYRWGAACDGWRLLSSADPSVIEERIPPGLGEVAHFHERARQLFYVLSGSLTIEMPDGTLRLERGDSLEVAARTVHRVHNPSDADAIFLVISSPTTAGDRINV
jgi:mannose-6-phosphate isomerase-like protein (cupin superfamily)